MFIKTLNEIQILKSKLLSKLQNQKIFFLEVIAYNLLDLRAHIFTDKQWHLIVDLNKFYLGNSNYFKWK